MANIGKVIVKPITRTTISSPTFNPVPVSLTDLKDVETSNQKDGNVLVYDAVTGKYIVSPLKSINIDIINIFGGYF